MPPMVSEQEIEREYKTLRNLRRRSASSPGPGALPLDPDLPPSTSSTSSSSSSYSSNDDIILSTPDGLDADNPAGLFWVPAHLHPELAPGEFRAFLKAHTHDPESVEEVDVHAPGIGGAGPGPGGMRRAGSLLGRNASGAAAAAGGARGPTESGGSGGGLGRKRSMLSRQYHPKAGDKVEEEAPPVPTLSRSNSQRSSIYGGRSGEKGLTLEDLQKLEMLADEAALSEDPESMRRLLRRSLSMNVAPGYSEDQVSLTDEADKPIIVPRPGSILRRSARTKIRKASLAGDGGGHRFAATRKGRTTAAPMHEMWQEDADDDQDGAERRISDESEDRGSGESQSQHDIQGGRKVSSGGESFERDRGGDREDDEERFYDAPQHIEQRRTSDDTSTEESNIFDADARNPSRSSSVSSSSVTPSESPSPEPSPPSSHANLPSLAPIVTPKFDGQEWHQSPGDKTPTQETVSDPMSGFRRPSPTDLPDQHPSGPASGPLGMTLQLPSDRSRYNLAGATSATAQQQPYRAPNESELLPGMAPPIKRNSIPPGIALQQKKSFENMTPVSLDRPASLSRTDSSGSALSASSTTSKEREKEKEKEKKGGFFSKKDKKDKEKDEKKESKKKDKDKFLGSLFGSKKKQEEPVPVASSFSSAAGSAAAAALLGSSKSAKSLGHGGATSPSPSSPGFSPYARYPIHVERAVYRLSHIKLANARRPLYEQVLISNLMFWYLGVIGKGTNTSEEKKHGGQPNGLDEKKEEAKPVIKGTPPTPVASGSAARPGYKPPSPEPIISQKKSSLTKPERSRNSRDAEIGVRPPQYGAQGAQMDKELRIATVNGGLPPLTVPPSQQMQMQAQVQRPNSQQQQQQQQHQLPPSQQYQHVPPTNSSSQNQNQRPSSTPSPTPNRALSPPSPSQNQNRPASEAYPHQPPPLVHRELQGPPRGVPHSSFGPPPAQRPLMSMSTSQTTDEPMRQRTLSQPSQQHSLQPGMNQGPGMGQPIGGMRRVVTDGQPPSPQHQHQQGLYPPPQGMIRRDNPPPPGPGQPYPPPRPPPGIQGQGQGPQPGQVFQYPNGPPQFARPPPPQQQQQQQNNQPGQIFQPPPNHLHPSYQGQGKPGPQPGQVFQHPQYRPLPAPGQLLPPGAGGPGPGRLPPGATSGPPGPGWIAGSPPPQSLGQNHGQSQGAAYNGGVPPQLRRAVSPPSGSGMYDPRQRPPPPPHPLGYPHQSQSQPHPNVNGNGSLSPPPQGYYQNRPPPPSGGGQAQPGQIFNPYPPGVSPPMNQGRGDEYRRQPQPTQGPYIQHR